MRRESTADPPRAPAHILLGIGSNVGSPSHQISSALRQLAQICSLEVCSFIYRTEPIGFREQPDFLNLVVRGRTWLSPLELLEGIRDIEQAQGRVRTFRNAPRTIDVDILGYDKLTLATPALTVPHPRLQDRAFVLVPLAEVAPEWCHPVLGKTAAELLESLRSPERVERWSGPPEW